MSEYVCELPFDDVESFGSGNIQIPVRERITRCKDCSHLRCIYLDDIGQYLWCSLSANDIEPNDFCSFADPKEAGDE